MLNVVDFIFDNNIEYDKPTILFVLGTAHGVDAFCEEIIKYDQIYNYKKIIISGYNGEAENIALNLYKIGVCPSKLILEVEAKNTLENIIFSMPFLKNYKNEDWHVMGKLYALPRVKLTVLKYCNNNISFIPVDLHNVNKNNWFKNKKFVRKIYNEFEKIKIYQEKGDILDFEKFFDLTSYNTFMEYIKNIGQKNFEMDIENDISVISESHTINDLNINDLSVSFKNGQVLKTSIIQRQNSVGIIGYDPIIDCLVFVSQFRAGPFINENIDHCLEVVAGYIDVNEKEIEAAKREFYEETNLKIQKIFKCFEYYPSPSITTEKMSIWLASINLEDIIEIINNGAEQLKIVKISAKESYNLLNLGKFNNGLTIISMQWFFNNKNFINQLLDIEHNIITN